MRATRKFYLPASGMASLTAKIVVNEWREAFKKSDVRMTISVSNSERRWAADRVEIQSTNFIWSCSNAADALRREHYESVFYRRSPVAIVRDRRRVFENSCSLADARSERTGQPVKRKAIPEDSISYFIGGL